jgi:hypothetical protein
MPMVTLDTVERGVNICHKGRIIYQRHIPMLNTTKACYENRSEAEVSDEFTFLFFSAVHKIINKARHKKKLLLFIIQPKEDHLISTHQLEGI